MFIQLPPSPLFRKLDWLQKNCGVHPAASTISYLAKEEAYWKSALLKTNNRPGIFTKTIYQCTIVQLYNCTKKNTIVTETGSTGFGTAYV